MATPRITIDVLFAPAPHELITDPHVSPPAFRLWCVLHKKTWMHEPPDIDALQADMRQDGAEAPTRRSIYRWLGELEAAGWLEWTRTPGRAGANDRFALKTTREGVTPESQDAQPVTPESQPVIVRSQVVTLRSQVPPVYPLPERPKKTTQIMRSDQKGGGGGTPALELSAPQSSTEQPAPLARLTSLFASYGITQAEPLARLYAQRWPVATPELLAQLCQQLYEPAAGPNAAGRLYRKLKNGPIAPIDPGDADEPRSPAAADRPQRPAARAVARGPVDADAARAKITPITRDGW